MQNNAMQVHNALTTIGKKTSFVKDTIRDLLPDVGNADEKSYRITARTVCGEYWANGASKRIAAQYINKDGLIETNPTSKNAKSFKTLMYSVIREKFEPQGGAGMSPMAQRISALAEVNGWSKKQATDYVLALIDGMLAQAKVTKK